MEPTVQLPLLNKEGLKVYDLSRSLNKTFRGAYLGGIVDVYRPHLEGGTRLLLRCQFVISDG